MRSLPAALASVALILPLLAGAAAAQVKPVACVSPKALYELLNAINRHDRLEVAQLEGAECQTLQGAHYQLVEAKNGIAEIRLFPRDDDWADSRVAYTLDEMLAGNSQ